MRNKQQTKWNNYDCAAKFATLQLSRIQSLTAIQPTFDAKAARILKLGLRKVAHAGFEVLAVRVHSSDHHFVAEDKLEIDLVRWYFDGAVTARDAGKNEHAIFCEHAHALEHDRRMARCFKHQIEWSILDGSLGYGRFLSGYVPRSGSLDQV